MWDTMKKFKTMKYRHTGGRRNLNRWHRLDLQQDHSRKLPKQGKTHPYRHKMHAEHQIDKTRKENPYHS